MNLLRLLCVLALVGSSPGFAQEDIRADSVGADFFAGIQDSLLIQEPDTLSSLLDSLPPARVDSIVALDTPTDEGGFIDLYWALSRDDVLGSGRVTGYQVFRATEPSGPFQGIATLGPGTDRFVDRHALAGTDFYYKIRTRGSAGGFSDSQTTDAICSSGQWFDKGKASILGALVVLVLFFLFTRTLPLLDEVWVYPAIQNIADALARAHEGPTVYVPGAGGLGSMSTIASLTLLDQIVPLVQDRGSTPYVYVADALTFAASQQLLANQEAVFTRFICPDRSAFSMAYTGEVSRIKPHMAFLVGDMRDEALLLAEADSREGALQVAGSDDVSQIPFLISTCELTLIGEVLFLAGPQLSAGGFRAATLLHDRLKKLIWLLIVVGIIGARLGWSWYIGFFGTGGN